MSDYLSGLTGANSYYTDKTSESTSKLQESLKSKDYSTATDEELMEACRSFEQYLIEQAMKGMEKMIPKAEEESKGTSYTEMFKDKMYEEYAKIATEQVGASADQKGIGIAQQLYEQMKRNYSSVSIEEMVQNAAASGAVNDSDDK